MAAYFKRGIDAGFELASQMGLGLAVKPESLSPGEYLSLKAHGLAKQKVDSEKRPEGS